MGPFTADFREEAIINWRNKATEMKINISPNFSLTETLGDPVNIRNWRIFGLPADAYSTDNAIILNSSRRWPLMIDPQGLGRESLVVPKSYPKTLLQTLSQNLTLKHILIQNWDRYRDPILRSGK